MIEGTQGKIPTNMWAACVEVRKKGAIGSFYTKDFIVRAEIRDIQRFILDEVEVLDMGASRHPLDWKGSIMNTLRGLLIDPEKKELSFVEVPYEREGHLKGFYEMLRCKLVDIVGIDKHPDGTRAIMIIDDEGLLRPNYHFGWIFSNVANVPFSGRCVIVEETPDGDLKSLPYSEKEEERFLDVIKGAVIWYGDDKELDKAIKAQRVSRPATYIGGFDNKTHTKIWEWEPHNLN